MQALPEHIRTPHLRPFQPIGAMREGKPVVALRDPAGLAGQTLMLPQQLVGLLGLLQGELEVSEICRQSGAPEEFVVDLVKRLDEVGLLWGPTSERLETELIARLRARGSYEIGAAGAFGDSAETATAALDALVTAAEDPELEGSVAGIVAPHLDAERGGPNYGAAYRALADRAKPTRVVILGTNHFGLGDGVVGARLGFDTPMGTLACDTALADALGKSLGDRLYKDELDHVGEHSIKLHAPWIARRFPGAPIFAALVPDPTRRMLADDGARVSHAEFIEALPQALRTLGGDTLFVASADLSHVGPQFGDGEAVEEPRQREVDAFDRAMLGTYCGEGLKDFLGQMASQGNPTRWCSIGNMAAARALLPEAEIELIQYRQSIDEKKTCLVTSAAIALCQP